MFFVLFMILIMSVFMLACAGAPEREGSGKWVMWVIGLVGQVICLYLLLSCLLCLIIRKVTEIGESPLRPSEYLLF